MSTPSRPEFEVEVETEELGGGEVQLSVRVPSEEVNRLRRRLVSAFARRLAIPGFRRGKAPRALVEQQVDKQRLEEEIMEQLLEPAYDRAVEKTGIESLGRARISDSTIAEDGSFTFKAALIRRPEIRLGEYRGLKATRHITAVTEAQVEAEMERLRSRYARFVELSEEETLAKGDFALVDYEGYVEEEKVEQASASGYPLEVGADELFPELNEGLLGARVGETKELNVASAPEHLGPEYAGKQIVYRVKVTSARRRELPPVDDEFAKQVSGLDTVEALRERIRENLEAIGRAIAEEGVRDDLTRHVCEGARLEVPASLVTQMVERRVAEIEEELQKRGRSLIQHLQNQGISVEDWRADLEMETRDDVRRALVLDEIGTKENIQIGDEEIKQEIARIAEREGVSEQEVRRQLSTQEQFNRLVTRLYHRKVVNFLVDNAEITEEVVEPTEETPTSDATPAGQTQEADSPGEE